MRSRDEFGSQAPSAVRLFLASSLILFAACTKPKPPASDVTLASVESAAHANAASAPPGAPDAASDPSAAEWTIEPTDAGAFRVAYRGADVATFHYLFWGANYSWADPAIQNLKTQAGVTTFDVAVDALGLKLACNVSKTGPGELTFDYNITTTKTLKNIVGGGIEFNLNLDLDTPGKEHPPVLLADKRGFKWDVVGPNDPLLVAFEPAVERTFFEMNQKNTLRAFIIGTELAPGRRKLAMKVRLPRGGAVRQSVDERYGSDDRTSWYPQTLQWDKWPVDVSFMNERPAGKHGHVKADGDRLLFEDGSPIRFWGTNVQAYALFHGKKEDIANQAKRLAALGYNLVRLHHHDSEWVTPNVFDLSTGNTQQLLDKSLDMLDWWVKCLKDEGIYVWMDLHVGRQFMPGDNIEGFAELAKKQGVGKGFNYVNPRIEKLMQDFASKYVKRTNRYTGIPYTEEPAMAAVLITNENDLTTHFGNELLPDKGNSVHTRMFQALTKELAKHGGLAASASERLWEPGPGKMLLNDLEHGFDQRAIDKLHADGVKSLIATTSYWGAQSLYSLPSLATGSIVDVHSYGKAESLGVNPRREANFIHWIGAAQIAGRPLSVSEWNVEYPNRDRFVAPLYVAAISALQGWDAPMIYGYLQGPTQEPEQPDAWSTWIDPALTALMPAAAVMYRQGHVRDAQKTYRIDLSRENLYYENTSPDSSAAIRTIMEQSKLTIGLPDVPELSWDGALSSKAGNATVVTDLAHDFIPPNQTFVVSDTGEIRRDWASGIETIDTPLSQAAFGWIGGRTLKLRDVTIAIDTPKASVALTSLDGQPIATSKKILLTVVAQVATAADKLPYLAQPVVGTIALHAGAPLKLTPLSPRANPVAAPPAEKLASIAGVQSGKDQVFKITKGTPTHWYLLTP
jgi:hypothetical protein